MFLKYLGSGLALLGLSRWVGRSRLRLFLIVAGSSLLISLTGVALNWQ